MLNNVRLTMEKPDVEYIKLNTKPTDAHIKIKSMSDVLSKRVKDLINELKFPTSV
jgi:hypothetical protein